MTAAGSVAKAELIADGGEAASGDEFFRSRPFLEAEGATHSLRIEAPQAALLAPLIVREIPGTEERDAVSPYGFPGLSVTDCGVDHTGTGSIPQSPLEPGAVDWSATGLVSLFVRHTLGLPPLAGATERNVVQIADPELPRKSRGSDRNQVNRNRRAGYEVSLVPGPQTTAEQRAGFHAVYEQTMRRTDAGERYFFAPAYFDRLLESPRSWLALAHAPGGEVAAASLLVRSDGFLHYYLSGSADPWLRDSPMKNVISALVDFSEEENLPLNLGGGIVRGDRLEEFKRGFANREQVWRTSEIVCDPGAYARLSAGRSETGFFPLYRSSSA
ncbi:MAG TPA: GNAT family N-acetyltransferase [Solirubrobacterales bacterium]|nr:GNAT family N-acetyltransferase [Solirubrobacterales bacterium]